MKFAVIAVMLLILMCSVAQAVDYRYDPVAMSGVTKVNVVVTYQSNNGDAEYARKQSAILQSVVDKAVVGLPYKLVNSYDKTDTTNAKLEFEVCELPGQSSAFTVMAYAMIVHITRPAVVSTKEGKKYVEVQAFYFRQASVSGGPDATEVVTRYATKLFDQLQQVSYLIVDVLKGKGTSDSTGSESGFGVAI